MKPDKDPELLFQLPFFKFHGKGTQSVQFVFVLGLVALGIFAARWL